MELKFWQQKSTTNLHVSNMAKRLMKVLGLSATGDGWYMSMMATNSRPGYAAQLESRFMNTTDMCVELFFQATSSSTLDPSTVSVIVVTEELSNKTLVSSNGNEPPMWNRLFAVLPGGINRVVIQGRRSSSGFSSLSVDDIAILPCSTFGNACSQHPIFAISGCQIPKA
jgi:hypothetical protein